MHVCMNVCVCVCVCVCIEYCSRKQSEEKEEKRRKKRPSAVPVLTSTLLPSFPPALSQGSSSTRTRATAHALMPAGVKSTFSGKESEAQHSRPLSFDPSAHISTHLPTPITLCMFPDAQALTMPHAVPSSPTQGARGSLCGVPPAGRVGRQRQCNGLGGRPERGRGRRAHGRRRGQRTGRRTQRGGDHSRTNSHCAKGNAPWERRTKG